MGCNCNKGSGRWKVTRPDGKFIIKNSEASARLAAGAVPGSTYEKMAK